MLGFLGFVPDLPLDRRKAILTSRTSGPINNPETLKINKLPSKPCKFCKGPHWNHLCPTQNKQKPEEPAGPCITFHSFGKLPTELRLRIWGFAVPDPQVVRQHVKHVKVKGMQGKQLRINYQFSNRPGVLQACAESRREFLLEDEAPVPKTMKHPMYRVCSFSPADMPGRRLPFCFEMDTLVMSNFGRFHCFYQACT